MVSAERESATPHRRSCARSRTAREHLHDSTAAGVTGAFDDVAFAFAGDDQIEAGELVADALGSVP